MTPKNEPAVAVLIDGDNVSHERIGEIVRFAEQYGALVIRRIYGDWTRRTLAKWKEEAKVHSFRLVEAPCYTAGKNTTDMALVIDAMDILHEGKIDCFYIAASDGDCRMPARRIRVAGLTVPGYGKGKTPEVPVASCREFRYAGQRQGVEPELPPNTPEYFIRRDMPLFEKAFETAAAGKDEVPLSQVGTALKKLMPKYRIKRYGCKTLGELYERLDRYELVKTEKGVAGMVRRKSDHNHL